MGTRLDVVGTTGGRVTLETVAPTYQVSKKAAMSSGVITGVVGRIVWGYYAAASVNGYTVTRVGAQWGLVATVVVSNPFNLSQHPLYFVAPHAKGEWRWPILKMEKGPDVGPNQIRATLGPPLGGEHGAICTT